MCKVICSCLFVLFSTLFQPYMLSVEQPGNLPIVPIYAVYSNSHAGLFKNWFCSSLQDANYRIVELKMDQFCPSGSFMKQGWLKAMLWKVKRIAEIARSNKEEVFIVSDVDIQFFGKTWPIIAEMLESNDFLAQRDTQGGLICAGFVVCRSGKKMADLWDAVIKRMVQSNEHDQQALNYVLKETSLGKEIRWSYLPNVFMGACTNRTDGGCLWQPGKILPITPGIVMHHANCTVGIKNKVLQLRYMRSEVKKRDFSATN